MTEAGFKSLLIWQKSMLLAKSVYELSGAFPRNEIYGLTAQIRRSSVSVPSNIAEGNSRAGVSERKQFFLVALGSLAELETQLLLAKDFEYLHGDQNLLWLEIGKLRGMLIKFIRSLSIKNFNKT